MKENDESDNESIEPRNFNFTSLKAENELFDEEAYKQKQKLINVKRIRLAKGGENWEIKEDGKLVLLMKGTRFSKGERTFLKTPEGMMFVLEAFKSGARSVVKIKEKLEKRK